MTTPNQELLADALRGLLKLIDDGDLTRNTDRDSDVMVFMRQGFRITNALKAAQDALNAHAEISNGTAGAGVRTEPQAGAPPQSRDDALAN